MSLLSLAPSRAHVRSHCGGSLPWFSVSLKLGTLRTISATTLRARLKRIVIRDHDTDGTTSNMGLVVELVSQPCSLTQSVDMLTTHEQYLLTMQCRSYSIVVVRYLSAQAQQRNRWSMVDAVIHLQQECTSLGSACITCE